MQLGTTAESLDDVKAASSMDMGPATLPAPQSSAEDETPLPRAQDETPLPGARDETPTHDAAADERASYTAAPAVRSGPPAVPAFLRANAASPTRTPSALDALDLALGAPLLPERAHDPHYYPGISDEPPPQPVAPPALPLHRRRLVVGAAGGAVVLLLLILGMRALFSGPSTAALVVDVNPPDARVTLDGELLAEASGIRKRTGLMNGEHVLAAERKGFVSQRRVFTHEAGRGDLRIVLALNAEPPAPLPPTAAAPAAADPEPAPEAKQAAAQTVDDATAMPLGDKRSSARELARQRRLERIRARREAREAAGPRATAAGPRAAKSGAPALLKLNSVPWAEVYIDKRHVGHTPLLGLPLTPGRHVIRLTNPNLGGSKTVRIKVSAGETVTQVVKL